METDWNTIRRMMNAAIDACERIERSGYNENDRDATISVNGQAVSVQDLLVSAWTYPENVRYQIIRIGMMRGSTFHKFQKPHAYYWRCPKLQRS